MDREAWRARVRGVARVRRDLVAKPPPMLLPWHLNSLACCADLEWAE